MCLGQVKLHGVVVTTHGHHVIPGEQAERCQHWLDQTRWASISAGDSDTNQFGVPNDLKPEQYF